MPTSSAIQSLQRRTVVSGAALITIGLFTGLWSGAALSGMVSVPLPRLALSAHLNALMGGFLLLGFAFSVSYLNFSTGKLKLLTWLMILPAWANWLITLVASLLGVNGLSYSSDPINNAVAFGLQFFVVVPSLIGSILWMSGFRHSRSK